MSHQDPSGERPRTSAYYVDDCGTVKSTIDERLKPAVTSGVKGEFGQSNAVGRHQRRPTVHAGGSSAALVLGVEAVADVVPGLRESAQ